MPDPNAQQQPQQSQDPGVLSSIESGVGKVLPYALPAVLGAALGGLGGAAAGVASGAGGLQDAQSKQADTQLKQQEMALKWQQFGLESKQAQMALKTAQSWQDYVQTLPDDQRALAMENPQEFTKNKIESGNWNLGLETLKKDTTLNASPQVINAIEAMGPTAGKGMLDSYMKSLTSGKFPNGVHSVTKPDGTTVLEGVGADGKVTTIDSGVAPQILTEAGANARTDKTIAAANARTDKEIAARTGTPAKPPSAATIKEKARAMAEKDWTSDKGIFSGPSHDDFVNERAKKYEGELSGGGGGGGTKSAPSIALPPDIKTTSAALKYLTMRKGMSAAAAKDWIRKNAAD